MGLSQVQYLSRQLASSPMYLYLAKAHVSSRDLGTDSLEAIRQKSVVIDFRLQVGSNLTGHQKSYWLGKSSRGSSIKTAALSMSSLLRAIMVDSRDTTLKNHGLVVNLNLINDNQQSSHTTR